MQPTIEWINSLSHEDLIKEWDKANELFGKYSCDCLSFYIRALGERIIFYNKLQTK